MNKITKKSAWLIQWDGTNEEYLRKEHIIAVFDPRVSAKKIKEFIENYYIANMCTNYEKLYYSSRKHKFPYQIEYGLIKGVKYEGSMVFGANPFISAEYVKNLCICKDKNGYEKLTWEKPKLNKTF
ncbi:MAG: hypothetical protein PHE80_02585 [Candidatus Omnitrophica bacterium]|nr:hypothetical protein [Candidatus Omnitrophota bacterium]MDD5737141.1 hypothetical protein [Candidatus Omnitrophota bacterium]